MHYLRVIIKANVLPICCTKVTLCTIAAEIACGECVANCHNEINHNSLRDNLWFTMVTLIKSQLIICEVPSQNKVVK